MYEKELPPQAQLMKFIIGRWISKPLYVAARLGIPDMLSEGPQSISDIARITGTHAPSLYRVMRALASVGIFREQENEIFLQTPLSAFLKSGLLRSAAIMFNAEWSDEAWRYFMEGIKTGETPFEKSFGMPLSAWLEQNPEAAVVFNEANAVKAATSHRAILDSYDFNGSRRILDVGGGTGALMIAILNAQPLLEGAVADLAFVTGPCRDAIDKAGLSDRCRVIDCDFFESIPSGFDTLLLSNILHDWPDDTCLTILRQSHDALGAGQKILIIEMIIPPGNTPSVAKLLDMEMLTMTGGRERTEAEYKALLEQTGFQLKRIIPTDEGIAIIEGIAK